MREKLTGWKAKEIKALLPEKWRVKRDYHIKKHVIAFRAGPMAGPGYISENAAQITLHHNYSGSGPDSFSGARHWPHLKIELALSAGTENKLPELAANIAAIIDDFIDGGEDE